MICKSKYPNITIKDLEVLGEFIGNYTFDHKKWLNQIIFYEESWKYYFCNIFMPIFNEKKNEEELQEIKVIIWESCPGGMVFPHPNYAFNNLDEPLIWPRDKFLIEAAKKVFNRNWAGIKQDINCDKSTKRDITKRDILNWISKEGYLIMDLLPTHGFEMKNIRKKITTSSSKSLINEGMEVIRKHWNDKKDYVKNKSGVNLKEVEIYYDFIRNSYEHVNGKFDNASQEINKK